MITLPQTGNVVDQECILVQTGKLKLVDREVVEIAGYN